LLFEAYLRAAGFLPHPAQSSARFAAWMGPVEDEARLSGEDQAAFLARTLAALPRGIAPRTAAAPEEPREIHERCGEASDYYEATRRSLMDGTLNRTPPGERAAGSACLARLRHLTCPESEVRPRLLVADAAGSDGRVAARLCATAHAIENKKRLLVVVVDGPQEVLDAGSDDALLDKLSGWLLECAAESRCDDAIAFWREPRAEISASIEVSARIALALLGLGFEECASPCEVMIRRFSPLAREGEETVGCAVTGDVWCPCVWKEALRRHTGWTATAYRKKEAATAVVDDATPMDVL